VLESKWIEREEGGQKRNCRESWNARYLIRLGMSGPFKRHLTGVGTVNTLISLFKNIFNICQLQKFPNQSLNL